MDISQEILGTLFDAVQRSDDARRSSFVADLAILTLLIDAKIATIEQACQRLELILSAMPERHQTDATRLHIQALTQWLRAHDQTPSPRWTPQVIEGGKDLD